MGALGSSRLARLVAFTFAAVLASVASAHAQRVEGLNATGLGATAQSLVQAAAVPPGFEETVAFSGLTNPMAVRFAPDGRIFVAEKSGLIKYFDGLGDPTATVFADLRTQVHDFWDRGMMGIELDPDFAANGRLYVLYARNEEPFNTIMPRWPDGCPNPPGATADGCVITGTLSRLEANGSETPLIAKDFCQQYPSHSVGGIGFGADGMLYLSAGDGASFNFADYGQDGNPVNPCGDPPAGVGGVQTPPTAEGGALRAQDLRTSGDPAGLAGTVLRLNPATGAAAAGNPLAGSADANARRIVAYGLRNPFRLTMRPGTSEVWLGDVGWNTWEEINRVPAPTSGVLNFGWPCYEGAARQGGYDGQNLNICENLYAAGASAHTPPYYAYNHASKVSDETCPTGGSAIAGLDFYERGPFPDEYDGALFFADYTRDCIWAMMPGANGLPDPANRRTFVPGASNPVDVQISPSGDLYYADLNGGRIMRVRWPNSSPTARMTASPTSGAAPLTVAFDGSGSSDPDGDPLGFAWDLDGDGAYDDSTAVRPSFTYQSAGAYTARLRVSDPAGATDTTSQAIDVGTPPTVQIDAPASATTWHVGELIAFSGSARDSTGNPLTATWTLNLRHCSRLDATNCHTHEIQQYSGNSGSFNAPDHEYPSHLELSLTATDGAGLTSTTTRRLDPDTVDLRFETSEPGLQLAVGSDQEAAPFTRTVIVGSTNSISAPSPQTLGGSTYTFSGWSDGGGQTHSVTAPAGPTTYRATFTSAGDPTLVAAYAFSQAGTSVPDLSGRANHGTVSGATWSSAGRHGGALSFDGVNDLVTVADSASLDLTSAMTLMGWVRPTAVTGWRTVLLKERPGGLSYALYAGNNGGQASGYIDVGGDRGVDGAATLPVNTWTHVAATYDGSVLRLFVNGTQVATRTVGGAIATSAGALRIGGNNVWGEWFTGLIDDVRVYSRALTAAAIQQDMATPIGGQPPAPTLSVSPSSLAFTGMAGGADPAAKDLAVSHDLGNLSWTASDDAAWLDVTPAAGASPATVSVRPRLAGLAAGTYTGTVTITAAGAQGSPKQVAVTLTVDPPAPVLSVTPASLTFSATDGGAAPAAQQLSVSNAGTGTLGWTASSSQSWLTVSPASGAGAATIAASVNPAGMAPGSYSANIRVTAAGAQGSPADVPVTLTVTSAQAPPGLVAALAFDEGQGAVVADLSGRGNAGTISGATWTDAGRFGRALTFDGTNDWVTVPDANALDLTTGMTIEAWVNPSALGDWRTVLLKERPGQLAYGLYAAGGGNSPSGWVSFASGDRGTFGTSALPTNAWSHLAATYDGSALRLWVNGVNVSSRALSGSIATSTMPLRIGGNAVWGEFFTGRIDEVRVYNRALSAAEVANDRDTPIGGGT